MKCILIDDEPDCLELLSLFIGKYCPELDIIGQYSMPKQAIDAIWEQRPDLVFLDVDMPEINGFGVLDACREIPFQVVFTTAYQEYAVKAFKYSATGYLLKPLDRSELREVVQKATQLLNIRQLEEQREILFNYLNPVHPGREKIALHNAEGIVFLPVADIECCKSDGNYSSIYLTGRDKALVFVKSLGELEEMLDKSSFFRVHNSYLVNLRKVKQYIRGEGGELRMENGQLVPVSRTKKAELLKRMEI